MPTGPAELHEKWKDDGNACEYLEQRGYKLTTDYRWRVPEGHTPTDEEAEAVTYLILEWDYGGVL